MDRSVLEAFLSELTKLAWMPSPASIPKGFKTIAKGLASPASLPIRSRVAGHTVAQRVSRGPGLRVIQGGGKIKPAPAQVRRAA